MPTVLTEGIRPGEFLVSEANGYRSRDQVAIAQSATPYVPGTVLGRVTATGVFARHDPAASDGTETVRAVLHGEVDAAAAAARGVVFLRDAEVNGRILTWPAGISAGAKAAGIAALADAGIIVR